jgi:hypothetical protein
LAELTRRLFAIGGCGCALTPRSSFASTPARGCSAIHRKRPQGFNEFAPELDPSYVERSTGQTNIDKAFAVAVTQIEEFFDLTPGVGLYDDFGHYNALTYPETFMANTDGTVVLGKGLLKSQLDARADDGAAILAILAHEFGHVLQNKTSAGTDLSLRNDRAKYKELNADFFAGLYLAYFSASTSISLYNAGRVFEGMGDTEFANVDHHGTPQERLSAIEFGFQVGQGNPKLRPREALSGSVEFIKRNYPA